MAGSYSFATLVAFAVASGLLAQGPTAAQYDSASVTRDVMIPVRDGKRMATDVYRPVSKGTAESARLPVL